MHLLLVMLFSMLVATCGFKTDPHYGAEKSYGQLAGGSSQDVEEDEPVFEPTTPSEGDLTPDQPAESPEPEEPGKSPTPGIEEEEEYEDPDIIEIDPDTLVENTNYRIHIDIGSALAIDDGNGTKTLGRGVRNAVAEKLATTVDDQIRIGQTFGDGVAVSSGSQTISSPTLDADVEEGQRTNSGLKSYTRVTGTEECPDPFVCVDELWFVPTGGPGYTLCFFDESGEERLAIPTALPPNYKAGDYAETFGEYGPYVVKRYASVDSSCDELLHAGTDPELIEVVNLTISSVDPIPPAMHLHKNEAFTPDFAVRMAFSRVSDHLQSPYLMETVGLSPSATYYVSESASKLVKIINKVEVTIDLTKEGFLGRLARFFTGMEGLQFDLEIEMCEDLLLETPVNHCDVVE